MTDAPKRIQRRRTKGWRMPENTVCVDRSTGFGNPFTIVKGSCLHMGKTTDIWLIGTWYGPALWTRETKTEAMELSVKAYIAWVNAPEQAALRDKIRAGLRGKNIACWCGLNDPCHGDPILEIANG